MKRLETIDGFISTKELGIALMRHAELMNDSLNLIRDSYINDIRLTGIRTLCELYEEYNLKLKILEVKKSQKKKKTKMKRLEIIDGFISTKELGIALIKHAELMNDSLNSISDSGINSLKLHNMRVLCELYEKYNSKLKTLEEEKIKNDQLKIN